jgi:Skp family chaperone for outer membrane proteins
LLVSFEKIWWRYEGIRGVECMKTRAILYAIIIFGLCPLTTAWPVTLVRVGYIDIDTVIQTYTNRYLETEITVRKDYLGQMRALYRDEYFDMSSIERMDLQRKIMDHDEALELLQYNKYYLDSTGDIDDDIIFQIVQRDIMEAIKKTSELEGYSLVIDNTGNFIYGSEDVNLTDKVLFRLDEKLLDLLEIEPLVPLAQELREDLIVE